MNTTIHNNIKRLLKSQNKDVKQLYTNLGITKPAFYARVNGNMSIGNLQQIADVLGVHITELLKDDEPQAPAQPSNHLCPHCGKPIKITITY